MTIKSCPHCAEYNHFDSGPRMARCWHCGSVANFANVRTLEEKLGAYLKAQIPILFWPLNSCARLQKIAPLVLLATLPLMVVMQLMSDSLDSTSINLWPIVQCSSNKAQIIINVLPTDF